MRMNLSGIRTIRMSRMSLKAIAITISLYKREGA
jgi:hypothetical protein